MNTGVRLAMICGAGMVFAAECGQVLSGNEGVNPSQPAAEATPAAAKTAVSKEAEIKIKGLCVGMDSAEAQKILADLLKDFPSFEAVPRMRSFSNDSVNVIWKNLGVKNGKYFVFAIRCDEALGQGCIAEDANGRVTGFCLDRNLAARLFDPNDLPYSDFVRKFADAFTIPALKESGNKLFRYYDSPSGVRVEVWLGKGLVVKRIAGNAEPDRK